MDKVFEFKDIPYDTVVSHDSLYFIIGNLSCFAYHDSELTLSELLNIVHSGVLKYPHSETINEVPFDEPPF